MQNPILNERLDELRAQINSCEAALKLLHSADPFTITITTSIGEGLCLTHTTEDSRFIAEFYKSLQQKYVRQLIALKSQRMTGKE